MPSPSPVLDHIVIDTRDRLDAAEARFRALGFNLTPRGHHTLGSSNHLAMFATDYLELLGFGAGNAMRAELQPFPVGLNGLVFKTADADLTHAEAQAAGLPILPVQAFSRPVSLGGEARDARFRTTRLDPTKVPMGRVYFCEHLTPELVWRPEWQAHPNGVRTIARIVVATPQPQRTAELFRGLFGAEAAQARDGKVVVAAGAALVELTPPAAVAAEFGEAAADPAGRSEYLAAVCFKVGGLDAAARVLGLPVTERRIVVPAATACNTTLVFEA
jgi:catechol 2,3-dioxygenase-like lactoylglutathione lyase family enzyme